MESLDILLAVDSGLGALGGILAGSIVAVTLAAFKLIERMQFNKAVRDGKPVDKGLVMCCPTDVKAAIFETKRNTRTLVEQHAPEQGVERWKSSPELMAAIQSIGETQRIQVRLMEQWDTNLERHRDREESVMTEIRDTLRDLLKEIK